MKKTIYFQQLPHDLSTQTYTYLSSSPPGYSIAIYLLLLSGLSLSVSMKMFEVFVWFVGIIGWALLGTRFIGTELLKLFFLWIIVTVSQNYFFGSNPSLCLWALMPYWTVFLLKLQNGDKKRAVFADCLVLSLIASLAILFRYQAIIFIPCGIVCIILMAGWKKPCSYLKGLVYSILPVITYGLISLKIYIENGYSTPLQLHSMDPIWEYKWLIYPFKNVSLDMFHFDKVLTHFFGFKLAMMNMGKVPTHIMPMSVISFISVCIAILGTLSGIILLWRRKISYRPLIIIFLVSFSFLSLFLFVSGVLLGGGLQPYFRERFFFYLQPLYLLIVFGVVNWVVGINFRQRMSKIFIGAIVFGILMWGAVSYAKMIKIDRYSFDLKKVSENVIGEICGNSSNFPITVIAPGLAGAFDGLGVNVAAYDDDYDAIEWDKHFFSKPTWLLIVDYTDNLGSFQKRAGMLGMKIYTKTPLTAYYRLFPVGKIKF